MSDLENMIVILLVTFHNVHQIDGVNQPPALSTDTLEEQYGRIEYAGLLFRHGDRTPTRLYPTDPYQNYSWPVDFGELTNKGKQGEYDLGKYFQPRYLHLTSEEYKPKNVIMHSSSANRCLMSAQLFLTGYFPPVGPQVWNEKLLWQPIPVVTAPPEYDNVISLRKPCPRRDQAIKHFYATNPITKRICANYSDTLLHIQKHTKLNTNDCKSKKTFHNLDHIQDTLLIESIFKLKLPEWSETVFPKPLTYLKGVLTNIDAGDHTVARLNAGPLLSVIAADMLNIAGLNHRIPKYIYSETRPLHLFSGHDGTIVVMLRALNIYQNTNPPYGATLGFELRSKDKSHHVTIIYVDSVHRPPKVLEIPGCSGNCSLTNFIDLIKPLMPQDWNLECQIQAT